MKDNRPKEMTEQEVLTRLTALCAAGEHSQQEMVEKMVRWGVDEATQARAMEYLTSHRYVDDERFAHAFVSDKLEYNKWGPRKIDQGLWAKGISEDIRRKVLSEVDDERFVAVLEPLLQTKRRSTHAQSRYELNGKLMRFAIGRGFTMEQIRLCLGDVDENTPEEP